MEVNKRKFLHLKILWIPKNILLLLNKKKTDYKVVKLTLLLVMHIVQKEEAVIWALNIDNKILVFMISFSEKEIPMILLITYRNLK